jgi:hypothetical protein
MGSAREVARIPEAGKANMIALTRSPAPVVAELFSTTPNLGFYSNLTRLDIDP